MKTENRDSKPRKFAWRKGFWVVVLIAASLTAQTASAEPTKEDLEKLREDLTTYTKQYAEEVEAIHNKYQKLLPYTELHAGYLKAKKDAEFMVSREGLFGYKALVSLAYKFAYDKVNKTSTAIDAIMGTMEAHYAKPLCDALRIYLEFETNFWNELHEADGKYLRVSRERIAKFSSQVRKDPDTLLDKWGLLIYNQKIIKARNSYKIIYNIWESIGLNYTASKTMGLYDKDIDFILYNLLSTLSAVTKKMSSAIIADGGGEEYLAKTPLPLGDIADTKITLGGVVWTAEEIYKMTERTQQICSRYFDEKTDEKESVPLGELRNMLEPERSLRMRVIGDILVILKTITL